VAQRDHYPPGDLARETPNIPDRSQWGLQRTAVYQEKLNFLGAASDDLVNQRAKLDQETRQTPTTGANMRKVILLLVMLLCGAYHCSASTAKAD